MANLEWKSRVLKLPEIGLYGFDLLQIFDFSFIFTYILVNMALVSAARFGIICAV